MKSFRDLADEFVSAIANVDGVISVKRGEQTANTITVENVVCTRDIFEKRIKPILKKFTYDNYYAYMHGHELVDVQRRLGQEYRYTVMLVMDLDEDETSSTSTSR